MNRVVLKYGGWVGLCPTMFDDPRGEEPFLHPTYPFTKWWLILNLWAISMVGWVMDLLDPLGADKRGYPLLVTYQVEPPRILEWDSK